MYTKKQLQEKLQHGLKTLFDNGTRSEHIAVSLGMSNAAILNWVSGRRIPKIPTIRQIEQIYHIRILGI